MLLIHVLAGAHARWGRACAVGLLLALLALAPLADASPPDPVWIPGIYDGADFDDVVDMATSLESRVDESRIVHGPLWIVARVPLTPDALTDNVTPLRTQARGPPTKS